MSPNKYPKRVEEYSVDIVNLREIYKQDFKSVYLYRVIDPDGSLTAYCGDPASSEMLAMKLTALDRQLRVLQRLQELFSTAATTELTLGQTQGSGTIWPVK